MKKGTLLCIALCLTLVITLFSGCGNDKYASDVSMAAPQMEYTTRNSSSAAAGEGSGIFMDADADQGSFSDSQPPENRKWIITVHLNAESEDLDASLEAIHGEISALSGYVESQNVYNGSQYSYRRRRSASLSIRIPADKVDAFTQTVSGLTNIVSKEQSLKDITLSYTATANRVEALQTEETRLLQLLSQAENMSDLLEIEARLTDVRYELENHASQLRLYDNQVDYATIYLSLDEVVQYTPAEEPTTWERIRDGFAGSIQDLGDSLVDLAVWLIVAAPFLLVYGAMITVVVILVCKARKKRKARKAAAKQAKQESENQ